MLTADASCQSITHLLSRKANSQFIASSTNLLLQQCRFLKLEFELQWKGKQKFDLVSKFRRKNRIFSNCRFANSRKFFEKQKTARSTNQRSIWLIFFTNWIFYLFFFFFDFLGILGHLRPRKYMKSWWKRCLVSNKKVLTLGDIGPGHCERCCTHLPWPPPPSGQSLLVEPATENVIH